MNIGHNSGAINGLLVAQYRDLLNRRDVLLDSMERAPNPIVDDHQQKMIGDLAVMIASNITRAEEAHKLEKEPFLTGGRIVDSFFKDRVQRPLEAALITLRGVGGVYLNTKKEAEERRKCLQAEQAAERAQVARESAEQLDARGHADLAAALIAEAAAAEKIADEITAEVIQSKPSTFARTRSDAGSLSTLRQVLVCKSYDRATLDFNALREHFSDDSIHKAVNSWMRANRSALDEGSVTLGGATIEKESTATYRR